EWERVQAAAPMRATALATRPTRILRWPSTPEAYQRQPKARVDVLPEAAPASTPTPARAARAHHPGVASTARRPASSSPAHRPVGRRVDAPGGQHVAALA